EVMHNLVIETTRMGIEIKNLKMRVESLTSRLEFNERRARALESVVVYKPSAEDRVEPPRAPSPPAESVSALREPAPAVPEGPGQRSRRRRRRRGRRGGGAAVSIMGAPGSSAAAAGGSSVPAAATITE